MQSFILLCGHLQSYSLIFLHQPGQLFAVQGRWTQVDEELGMRGCDTGYEQSLVQGSALDMTWERQAKIW